MPLISAAGLSMHFGGPLLFDRLDLKIEPGDRIGLIGRNGTGKSTLLKIFTGEQEASEGRVVRPANVKVGYQAQEMDLPPTWTVLDAMRDAMAERLDRDEAMRTIEAELAEAQDDRTRERLLATYDRLQLAQADEGAYDVEHKIRTTLTRLGLREGVWEQPLGDFSGGERNIIALARLIASDPDVLLLDEPSNHLDMDGLEWFIRFLRSTKAAVLMVSHDRHLLDATVKTIWELESQKITSYSGNYSDYQRLKAEDEARRERQWRAQQRLIARIEFQARRLRDMANAYDDPGQAKRAKAMMRRIERMEIVERPKGEQSAFSASFAGAARHGRIALQLNDLSLGYDERTLLDGVDLEIEYGERVCLVGPNGAGKTTLLRAILNDGAWTNTTVRTGKATKVGEYRQLHDVLDLSASLVDWTSKETGLITKDAASLLHRFQFSREDLDRSIGTLSGGEKSRLQLARLAHAQVNFLLLDEPTNHLDIQACEQLEEMLQQYEGTLLIISHDRYFLDKLVDRVLEIRDQSLIDHPMRFAAWFRARQAAGEGRRAALETRGGTERDKDAARKAHEAKKAAQRERRRLESAVERAEADVHELESKIANAEARLEALYAPGGDVEKAAALMARLEAARAELERAYSAWEGAAAALEMDRNEDAARA